MIDSPHVFLLPALWQPAPFGGVLLKVFPAFNVRVDDQDGGTDTSLFAITA
jgi:hypothetical protein